MNTMNETNAELMDDMEEFVAVLDPVEDKDFIEKWGIELDIDTSVDLGGQKIL